MASELFKMQAGVDIVSVPYKGTSPAIQDVIAGQVQLMFAAVGNARAQIKAGRLKPLGVTAATRLAQFPGLAAIAETLPGYESSAWFGLFGPAGMSPELARRLGDAAREALRRPELKQRLETEGLLPVGDSPEAFDAYVRSEITRWAKVVQFSGATPQ